MGSGKHLAGVRVGGIIIRIYYMEKISSESGSLALCAWVVGSAWQGQFLCFESLPDRQALIHLSHIPGQQETVIF